MNLQNYNFTRHIRLLLITVAVMGLVCPAAAQVIDSNLGGSILLDWASYRHEDGSTDVDGSHFFQQYSLMYESKGIINSGRAGKWDVALGYEWNDLSSELADRDYDATTDKILYRGDILFAPGGLPLRVHAYSQDLNQSSPSAEAQRDFWNLIDPGILSTINNGQHINTGLTLLAGIKNGSYLGEYREMLSQFPKLLVDFREDLVRDTERPDPVHYRMRDLAFVSLNKKDNWFHFRHQDYQDYEDSENDFTEKTFLVGTVDHLYRRQWINLTNWIKISADVSLTQYEEAKRPWEDKDTYALNLFSKARRGNLDVANFATFRRSARDNGVESTIYFPIFASGALDHQSTWRLMLVGDKLKDEYFEAGTEDRSEEVLYGRFQLETTRYPGYILTPELELENSKTWREHGNAARIGFELSTNDSYKRPLDWIVGYTLTMIDGEDPNDESVSFLGHELLASFRRRIDPRMEVGATQRLLAGSGGSDGDGEGDVTSYITPWSMDLAENGPDEASGGSTFGSYTTAYLELTGNSRMMNRFEASFIYEKEDTKSAHLLELSHKLTSSLHKSTLRMVNVFREGENIRSSIELSEVPDTWRLSEDLDRTFSHSTELSYRPNRAWEFKGEVGLDWLNGEGDDVWLFNVEQESRYSLYQIGGLSRKILEAYQLIDYEQTWGMESIWYARLELGVDWSPYRRILVGGNVTLEYWDQFEQTEVGYELYAAVDFQKLRAKTAYEYRQLDFDDDSSTPKVKDSRVTVSVQKIF